MKAIRTLLAAARTVGDAALALTDPSTLVRTVATTARDQVLALAASARTDRERIVPGPVVDEPPTAEEVVTAIEEHESAREQYNAGARGKRAARKTLDRTPTGEYGDWSVTWVQSSRRTWDNDAIAAVFAELGREIPTKPSAPTLKLTRADRAATEASAA